MKNIGVFLSENFQYLEVKFYIYLNRHVFVMIKCTAAGRICFVTVSISVYFHLTLETTLVKGCKNV